MCLLHVRHSVLSFALIFFISVLKWYREKKNSSATQPQQFSAASEEAQKLA